MTDCLKSLLFCLDPEKAHDLIKSTTHYIPLNVLGLKNQVFASELEFQWQNLKFKNPIGLAAGFDKSGDSQRLIRDLGFGFVELGSVSYYPCSGNPKPRIFRLLKDNALINWMGLPNPGAEQFLKNLKRSPDYLPRGISLVKTPEFVFSDSQFKSKNGIDDYVDSYTLLHKNADYICLNLSCPNSGESKFFEHPALFESLASEISLARSSLKSPTPILIKLSPSLVEKDLKHTVDLALKYNFDGFVVSNTTSHRPQLQSNLNAELKKRGGLSGKPLLQEANQQLKRVYEMVGSKKLIMGVGGIHDLASLLSKLEHGASCFQLYTGLIYGGVHFVRNLNLALTDFCRKQGVKNYQDLVGKKIL